MTEKCLWTENTYKGGWDSECGNYSFIEDISFDNNPVQDVTWCHKCGKEITTTTMEYMTSSQINDQINLLPKSYTGGIFDGNHTFDELYYHRMVLFSVICNQNPDIAWKSYAHDNGEVWDGYFIVGITTPEGEYTYHYKNKYWGEFNVKELDKAPKYDGHRAEDITRLLILGEIHNGN